MSNGMVWTVGFVRGFFWMARSSRVRRRVHMSFAMFAVVCIVRYFVSLELGEREVADLLIALQVLIRYSKLNSAWLFCTLCAVLY